MKLIFDINGFLLMICMLLFEFIVYIGIVIYFYKSKG